MPQETSSKVSAVAPGLPTVAASGLPGYEVTQILGVFAAAKTPATIIRRLNEEIVRTLNSPVVKETYTTAGDLVVASSSEQFASKIKSEVTRWRKLIKDANIHAE